MIKKSCQDFLSTDALTEEITLVAQKISAWEKWIVKQIHFLYKLRNELAKIEESLKSLPSVQDVKDKEKKQIQKIRKKLEEKREKDSGVSSFAIEEQTDQVFARNWKEFDRELKKAQESMDRIKAVLIGKGVFNP